ncbi:uncharacterized protein ARMOST_21692 [Armillaria ostoyae]|uniref:Uncharacterized protein n=1 Tax=Armillaria ostoyae TaxID=47428 RepID=A0A284SAS5_ARMOS|nr:uncharacterized protein ARMOST_21692 [Armillaria ostoyae]
MQFRKAPRYKRYDAIGSKLAFRILESRDKWRVNPSRTCRSSRPPQKLIDIDGIRMSVEVFEIRQKGCSPSRHQARLYRWRPKIQQARSRINLDL